jgi:hypothetical protein
MTHKSDSQNSCTGVGAGILTVGICTGGGAGILTVGMADGDGAGGWR